jgi:hypothetical protein
MQLLSQLKMIFLGSMDLAHFVACLASAAIGAFAVALFQTTKRDPHSLRTPDRFSWKFWWVDNRPQTLGTIICIIMIIRLSQIWFSQTDVLLIGSIIGVCSDMILRLVLLLRKVLGNLASGAISNINIKGGNLSVDEDGANKSAKETDIADEPRHEKKEE